MGVKKITDLQLRSAVSDDCNFVVDDGIQSYRITAAQLRTFINPNPIGSGVDYFGSTLPAGHLWGNGAAVSRTTYAALFAIFGTTYGAGDGSTTFNLPDKRGRQSIGKDDMGATTAQNRVTTAGSSIDGITLGANGGAQNRTVVANNLPTHTHPFSATSGNPSADHTHGIRGQGSLGFAGGGSTVAFSEGGAVWQSNGMSSNHTHSVSGTTGNNTTTAAALVTMDPSIVCNYIIKYI